jgi:hypothetical protein
MRPFGYIGIDFGTSNTHFAHCVTDGDPPQPETIRLGDSDSQTTCVLWKVPKERLAEDAALVEDYGTMALHAWLEHQLDGHAGGHFGFGFKPDLLHSEQARLDAWAFLHKACEEIRQVGLPRPISATGYAVVVGVPAEVGAEHRGLTAEIARKAGYGEVVCVEEPLGALAYHLTMKHVTPAEARQGVLVVDFGGGTLDVALVNAKGLHEPWGDPTVGGRLFDDLFYQWVADQNQPLEVEESEALIVWQKECRRLKEDFSVRWRRKGDDLADFKGIIKVGGAEKLLRRASVREFEERARRYRPSLMVRKYFRGLDRVPNGLVLDTPINLFNRIRQTLTRGGQVGDLKGKFSKVILTGGSSNWPFMRRLVAEAFGVDAEKDILMSQTPETTIGSGLALYYVLKLRNDTRREQIEGQKPQAKVDFEKAAMGRLDRYADDVAGALLNVLMPRVEKVYWDWYNDGGSLNQVEISVKQICKDFEKKEAKGIVERYWVPLNTDLVRLMRDHLAKFLTENEIPGSASQYIPESVTSIEGLRGDADNRFLDDVGDMAAVVALIAAVALLVLAAVKVKVLGAVLLAAMHNPPLAVGLGIAALIAAGIAGQSVKETVEEAIKQHEFNWVTRKLLKVALWEGTFRDKLAEGRAEARTRLRDAIRKSTRELDPNAAASLPEGQAPRTPTQQQALETFEHIIDVVIQDLGVLEQIRPAKS